MYITSPSILVPTKHGVERLGQFRIVGLINTTAVNPEMRIAISGRLRPAEVNLAMTKFVRTSAVGDILKSNLFFVLSPGMREDSIWRDVIKEIFGQGQPAVNLECQEAHREIEAFAKLCGYQSSRNLDD